MSLRGALLIGLVVCFLGPGAGRTAGETGEGSAGKGSPAAERRLPDGVEAIPEAGRHHSGWPLQIRCVRDGAEMVFVPAGEFLSGATDEQLTRLAALQVSMEHGEPSVGSVPELFEGYFEAIKPGSLPTREDTAGLEQRSPSQLASTFFLAGVQKKGVSIPERGLKKWRAGGRRFALLRFALLLD